LQGEVSRHARECSGDAGLFLFLRRSSVLMIADGMAVFGPSPYLDAHGEEDPNLRRGRTLTLNATRWQRLTQLFSDALVAQDVARRRNNLYAHETTMPNGW
jgi:E3 ubiquitin-protein ligase UBR1